jgi:hypothetical protein
MTARRGQVEVLIAEIVARVGGNRDERQFENFCFQEAKPARFFIKPSSIERNPTDTPASNPALIDCHASSIRSRNVRARRPSEATP